MTRLRILLIPCGVVIELVLFAFALLLALISPRHAEKIATWVLAEMPGWQWYCGSGQIDAARKGEGDS